MKLTKQTVMEFLYSGFLDKRNATFSEGEGIEGAELFGAIHKDGKDYVLVLDAEDDIQNLSVLFCETFPELDSDVFKRAGLMAYNSLWTGRGVKVFVDEEDNSASFCLSFPTQMTSDLEFTLDYAMDSIDISALALDEALEKIGQEQEMIAAAGFQTMVTNTIS